MQSPLEKAEKDIERSMNEPEQYPQTGVYKNIFWC